MAAVKEIDPPFTIATLTQPLPIKGTERRILSSGVYSLSGSKKRKRAEVAVSSDGEGIQIYNVQTPRTVASYAIPPSTSFTSAPCCIYRKASAGRRSRRCTYAATADTSNGQSQVICFNEETEPKALGNVEKYIYNIGGELGQDQSEVLSIEIIPGIGDEYTSNSSHNVLVVFKNGRIECLSADLEVVKWTYNLEDSLPNTRRKDTQVEYVHLTSAYVASRGLLKERDDVLAIMGGTGTPAGPDLLHATPVLSLISRSTPAEMPSVHIFALRPYATNLPSARGSEMRYLTSWKLTSLSASNSENSTSNSFYLQADVGSLTCLSEGRLMAFDLRGTTAKETTSLTSPEGPFRSFLRLTSSLALANSGTSCGLFDMNYHSLQALLRSGHKSKTSSEEKKRDSGTFGTDLKTAGFVCYLSTLDLAVAMSKSELIGLPLGSVLPKKRSRQHEGLLINSIGKGISSKTSAYTKSKIGAKSGRTGLSTISNISTVSPTWKSTIEKLDQCAANEDVHGFESVFANAVGIERNTDEYNEWLRHNKSRAHLTNGIKPHVNGVSKADSQTNHSEAMDVDQDGSDDAPLPSWTFPPAFDAQERFQHRPLALHALSKMFSWAPEVHGSAGSQLAQSSIAIRFYAPNVFQYLLMTECLTRDTIQRALKNEANFPGSRSINEGDIISSLVTFEPDMRILQYVLNSGSYLDIEEIAQAVKFVVQQLDDSRTLPQLASQLLTNGGGEDLDSNIDDALDSMSDAIDQAESSLDKSILLLTHCLQAALTTLHSFPKARIVNTLRKKLSHHELFSLMNLLRLQLRSGGWISRYFDNESDASSDIDSPSDSAILIIAELLAHVLDTIGTGGWLLAAQEIPVSSEDAPDELISALHLEIQAALEGISEALYLQGALAEFLRYGNRTESARALVNPKALQHKKKPYPLFTTSGDYGDADAVMLPLGLNVKQQPEAKKNDSRGNPVVKTSREIGLEMSKRVPKYSIERIDI